MALTKRELDETREAVRLAAIKRLAAKVSVPARAELYWWTRPGLRPYLTRIGDFVVSVVPSSRQYEPDHVQGGQCTDRLSEIHDAHLQGLHTCADCPAAANGNDCWHRWMDDIAAAEMSDERWSFGYFRPNVDGVLVNVQTGETFGVLPPIGGMNG